MNFKAKCENMKFFMRLKECSCVQTKEKDKSRKKKENHEPAWRNKI